MCVISNAYLLIYFYEADRFKQFELKNCPRKDSYAVGEKRGKFDHEKIKTVLNFLSLSA
jgi:hypothetical protein